MRYDVVNARITPEGHLDILSKEEVSNLLDSSQSDLYNTYRNCSLAVLNCGSGLDNGRELLERYADFEIHVLQQNRGIKLDLKNAPAHAFVDNKMIKGINEHLFAVLRDIIYTSNEIDGTCKFNLKKSAGITDAVFHILRNAGLLKRTVNPNLVVCWGGHSIKRLEYDYTKEVGHEMGLRNLDICTGCGPGAMKGPMKGAAIGHSKQRIRNGRYIGLSEPGIIAAESPNPIVNNLIILPDIEKRLEAFVRSAHAIVVFPGGAGTAEEILYILGILLNPKNADMPFPLILTGPKDSANYFAEIHQFIGDTLGPAAQQRYKIVIDNPAAVARLAKEGIEKVRNFRLETNDAYYFNWMLNIDHQFQKPFHPTHENMANLALNKNQEVHQLAANLRQAFSGIVAGNVKAEGIKSIEEHGLFEIRGDKGIMKALDSLLSSFVASNRMKLPGTHYSPCYKIIK